MCPHQVQTLLVILLTAGSTMARSFSLALNDLFKIDNSLADLDAAVSEKCVPPPPSCSPILTPEIGRKRAVSTQTSELEALEARLKAAEERLKQAAGSSPPGKPSFGRMSPRPRMALGDTFTASPTRADHPPSPLAAEFRQNSRPNTAARQQADKEGRPASEWKQEAHPSYTTPPMPGALPPTPGASEGESDSEYIHVGRKRTSADIGQDGDTPK
jgi:hypothetical protein